VSVAGSGHSLSLSQLRFPLERARGRRFPEPEHPYRNDFQRDRDRIVHARAFRRLENKTQVFTAGISDHFRNRLTHTIEVSQIARTVAATLGLDEDLTEALALAHDIGHPPFGHSGEAELDRLMRPYGERFDHNLHALRIVETFENRYARFPGLNLTFEVREGIVKHSRDFAAGEFPELDEYLPGQKPPLEAQLIDLCDEIAYDTADLDDGYFAGLVAFEDGRESVECFREFEDTLVHQYPGASERVLMHEVVRALINWLVSGLIQGTYEAACELASIDDVRINAVRVVRFTPETAEGAKQLKSLLRSKVYESRDLVTNRARSARKLGRVFQYLIEHPASLPVAYREESAEQPLHRQVCDYIAGMTDGFFEQSAAAWGIE
jgi:dGTPase